MGGGRLFGSYYFAAKYRIIKRAFLGRFCGEFRVFYFHRNQILTVLLAKLVFLYIRANFFYYFLVGFYQYGFFFFRGNQEVGIKNFTRVGFCLHSCLFFYFLVRDFCIWDTAESRTIMVGLFPNKNRCHIPWQMSVNTLRKKLRRKNSVQNQWERIEKEIWILTYLSIV